MGYCDDFYLMKNIIGYTGSINNQPTVYFKNAQYHGHITQFHHREYLIGRSFLQTNEGYQILNYSPDMEDHDLYASQLGTVARERGNMFEVKFGRCFHVSRNPFISIPATDTSFRNRLPLWLGGRSPQSHLDRENLAKAIILFQDINYKSLKILLSNYRVLKRRAPQERTIRLRSYGYNKLQDMERHITRIKEDRSTRHPEEAGIESIEEWSAFISSKYETSRNKIKVVNQPV